MARAFVPFSIEVGMDWASFQNEMAGLFADAKDVLEATKFALGSGTNEPFGVITGATTVFTASNTNSLVVADLSNVHNALGPRFRSRATWTMNNSVADKIRQLDTAGGANLWSANLTVRSAAVPATLTDGRMGADLFGKAVYEATAQSGAFTTGQKIAVVWRLLPLLQDRGSGWHTDRTHPPHLRGGAREPAHGSARPVRVLADRLEGARRQRVPRSEARSRRRPMAKKKKQQPKYPDTPSGKALAKVGDLNGEDAEDSEKALEHGEAYQAEKRKHRWGTG